MQLTLTNFSPVPGAFFGVDPCPRCGSRDIWPEVSGTPYGLYCLGCQWGGPRASAADGDPDAAISAWNDEARKVALAREMGLRVNLDQPKENPDEC
jgi:Restriction alleviation protein Lar